MTRSSSAPAVVLGALGLLLGATGCDPDCGNPARIDGTYEVWQNVIDSDAVSGENLSAYPYDDTIFNGGSEWTVKWVPGASSFQLAINGQPFTGTYSESETSCNTFDMVVEGDYPTEAGSTHALVWEGQLTWFGDELAGSFSYQDTWENETTDGSGSINVPEGNFAGVLLTTAE